MVELNSILNFPLYILNEHLNRNINVNSDDSGVVTVLRKNKVLKIFDNLVTKIDSLAFNNDSKLLLAFSSDRKNAIRLVR